MAKAKKVEEKINLDSILFKCRDILRAARNSGSFFEKRDMMLTLVFLRFIGEKFEDGVEKLRQDLVAQGLDPDDEEIFAAFFDDATFTDGTYNLPVEARWSTIINTPAPGLNVALDTALHSIATSSKQLKGCFVEGTFTTRNLAPNDIKKIVDEVNKISHKAFGEDTALLAGDALIGLGLETIVHDINISDTARIAAMKAITNAMGPKGMIYGQELDLAHEDKPADKQTLNTIHRHKTGKMISLCGKLGSIDSVLSGEQKESLELFFDNVGLVFQIVDDILDVEGDQAQLGKPIGSDSGNNKSTFISLYGLEESKKIAAQLTQQANDSLKKCFGNKSEKLIEYTTYLLNRKK